MYLNLSNKDFKFSKSVKEKDLDRRREEGEERKKGAGRREGRKREELVIDRGHPLSHFPMCWVTS